MITFPDKYTTQQKYTNNLVITLMQTLHSKYNSKFINENELSFMTLTPKQPETFKLRSLTLQIWNFM